MGMVLFRQGSVGWEGCAGHQRAGAPIEEGRLPCALGGVASNQVYAEGRQVLDHAQPRTVS